MNPNSQLVAQVWSVFQNIPPTPPNLLASPSLTIDKMAKTIGQLLIVIDRARSIIDTAGSIVIATPGYLYMAKAGHALLKMKLFYHHRIKTSHGRTKLLEAIDEVLKNRHWSQHEFPPSEEYRHTDPYCLSELLMVQSYLTIMRSAIEQIEEKPTIFGLN